MGDFVFCFDYISTWHCISNQRLVPCNPLDTSRHSNLGHSQPSRKLPPRRSHGGPISPHWDGSRPAQSCLQYVTRHQETESDGSHFTSDEVTQANARNECSPKMGLLFGGMWGLLRSDTLCYFVAPGLPSQFLGDNWEDTPTHSHIYTTVTHMHTRAHTQSTTRK